MKLQKLPTILFVTSMLFSVASTFHIIDSLLKLIPRRRHLVRSHSGAVRSNSEALPLLEHQHCIEYQTDCLNQDSGSDGMVEVKIKYGGVTKGQYVFALNDTKVMGDKKTICQPIYSPLAASAVEVESVEIRHATGNDAWQLWLLRIQEFPGSPYYRIYTIDPELPKFWTDGDESCLEKDHVHWYKCCSNHAWCNLNRYELEESVNQYPLHCTRD